MVQLRLKTRWGRTTGDGPPPLGGERREAQWDTTRTLWNRAWPVQKRSGPSRCDPGRAAFQTAFNNLQRFETTTLQWHNTSRDIYSGQGQNFRGVSPTARPVQRGTSKRRATRALRKVSGVVPFFPPRRKNREVPVGGRNESGPPKGGEPL